MTSSANPLMPIGSAVGSSPSRKAASQLGHVGVDRDQVVGHVGVHDPAVAVVDHTALQQRHADPGDIGQCAVHQAAEPALSDVAGSAWRCWRAV